MFEHIAYVTVDRHSNTPILKHLGRLYNKYPDWVFISSEIPPTDKGVCRQQLLQSAEYVVVIGDISSVDMYPVTYALLHNIKIIYEELV